MGLIEVPGGGYSLLGVVGRVTCSQPVEREVVGICAMAREQVVEEWWAMERETGCS